MAEPAGTPGEGGRQVNLGKLVNKLTDQLAGAMQQLAAAQVVMEEQDEEIRGLRAELVRVSSGRGGGEAKDTG